MFHASYSNKNDSRGDNVMTSGEGVFTRSWFVLQGEDQGMWGMFQCGAQ